ncbi:formamidopyrimidine-DNA glycosylase [Pullulanibacillus pueri]|uniref:Formamidopyrimidine-DNA glycosylase n=1 Tax=Pullulanibacillus pueri TaxID=1437324 RepID=A0A8J3EKQ6_9BACL|nr:bifunctional DNA-formamidopyrimidine glycosylase/DNA-(apurinic or apyrimidinic site) lyase [Pullulanibacillus pueri]MBM7681870.1 formamidopyrimidine-DNA glycosylase [Pullulanibacillus pueri]GGH76416.1 DNA-formamidopyrimidine glycosylase [Pullulanibacillus pueri]
MPELPEMENYKRLLHPMLRNKTVDAVVINRSKSVNEPENIFMKNITGKEIIAIDRRAKYLLFHLDSGHVLLLHLMLGGKLFFGKEEDSPDRTKQIIMTFGEDRLFFIGLRLGYLHILTPADIEEQLGHLGPEPLDSSFTLDVFKESLTHKRTNIKNVLLDQDIIAGIGNRYSDEICFEAKILPKRKTIDLAETEVQALFQAIKMVLTEAVAAGGYMDQPLFKGDNQTGRYLPHFKVHGKEGAICPRCGGTIEMETMASRKVYYCPQCQH